ncbi:ABC transporter permease [Candidatus Nitrosocosmicus franklandus]|uniref:Macrolide export ATP-binding/permease protein MacB n=1 Tax=Candidatus Nitrosocosmicus franklandianus TaxID=1798806 RepID=A0A484I4P5_9ARCH|nr:FtsX-like permease family protein [Candidatus Nitrosocosmicus franklandus]VFJ12635.1 Macrolide export ATP-binding/permease protein MacB [Candidatus Nitrosocosmicus franklandus]
MNFKQLLLLAFNAIKERKVRSILTILMVMAGSSLLVAVSGFSAGFTEFFNKQFSNLAPNILFVSSIPQSDGGSTGGAISGPSPAPTAKITLNQAVISRIGSLPFVDEVVPSFQETVTVSSRGDSKSNPVLSVNPTSLTIIAPTLKYFEGSSIREGDPSAAILAEDVAFPPGEDVPFAQLGEAITLTYSFVDEAGNTQENSKNFVVSGIMESTGNPTIDSAIVINVDAGNSLFQRAGKFDSLFVAAEDSNSVDIVEEQIKAVYKNNIGITTVKAILETVQEFTAGITSFLFGIAIISLIVGAVGIITTLFTSVVERTKEIGTLKAIGASGSTILMLFLVEAIIIGMLGGTVGLLGGIGGGYMLTRSGPGADEGPPLDPIYTVSDLARVWITSVILSMVAGFLPAWKASRVTPIAALRT